MTTLRMTAAVVFLVAVAALPAAGQERAAVISCVACHEGLGGELAAPVAQWKESIHARNGIDCASCHGGDPAVSGQEAMSPEHGFRGVPGETEVPGFCGRCHPGVEEDYRDSAHGRKLGHGGPQCVTCHGAHAVVKASPAIINRTRCTTCHSYGRADEIKSALVRTDALISRIDGRIAGFHRIGYATKDLEERLFQVRNEFHRLFHTIDVERIRHHTAEFGRRLSALEDRLGVLDREQSRRRLLGGVVVGLLVLLTGLLAALRLSYQREERQESDRE